MKNFSKVLICALVLALLLAFPIKSDGYFSAAAETQTDYAVTSAEAEAMLKKFVGGESGKERLDRTSFSEGEKLAAQFIADFMNGAGWETRTDEFEYTATAGRKTENFRSQNVVSVLKCGKENAKRVIVGANYDNQTSDVKVGDYPLLKGTEGHGAYMNGTGVATLLALAHKLTGIRLDFDLYFVFFGAGEVYNRGAESYAESLKATEIADTLMMVNLQRIGGDKIYAYSDEVKTDHGTYVTEKSKEYGEGFHSVADTLPRMDVEYVLGIGYTHMGMVGGSRPFADRNVPYVNVFGGTFDNFGFALDESKGKKNIAYTKDDTTAAMDERMSGYADKMSNVANTLYGCFTSDDFAESVKNARENKMDYSLIMTEWIPYVIVIGTLILFALAMIPIAGHFSKKYPIKKITRKVKVAVFGMDYEDKDSGDVFIDLKKSEPRDPFDGY